MRLIDADALKEKLPSVFIEASCRDCPVVRGFVGLGNLINDAPTVDAVEVVRCKDCDYGYLWTNFFGRKIGKCAFLIGDNQCVPEDGYCYVGKRKEQ